MRYQTKISSATRISEHEFYGDIVYNYRKIVGKPGFSGHFSTNIICYKEKRYNIRIIKQSACLAASPVTVDNYFPL